MLRRNPIKIREAISRVMEFAEPTDIQYLSLLEANGYYLAEDLISDHPVPPFDRSPYDGFAVRSRDTLNASSKSPKLLKVVGSIGAGQIFSGVVGADETVRIMTGAKIPEGCDAVIMIEAVKEVDVDGEASIHVRRPIESNKNISFTGEDIEQGTTLVESGAYISPGIIALLATFGYNSVPVRKKPKVGVIVTGSELLDVDKPLEPGKIRNSNGYMVYAQTMRAGGDAVYLGKLSDDFNESFNFIASSLSEVDVLITTGGVSVGDFDFMPGILDKLGANVLFNKIGMRPGSVTTVAEKDGKLIFALSGNPSACYVGFELLARPFLTALSGAKQPYLEKTTAYLGADFLKRTPFDRFVRGNLSYNKGKFIVTPLGLDKSSVVSSLAEANALIVFPAGTKGYRKGMEVEIILLESKGISTDLFGMEEKGEGD